MADSNDFVVRFAGEGGQGMVTSAEGLAQAAAQAGYHVLTYVTFPSQILGGPTLAQTRISSTPILSPGDELVNLDGELKPAEPCEVHIVPAAFEVFA